MKQRRRRKFHENQANTERYKESSVPYMQKLLNKEDSVFKNLLSNSHSKLSLYASEPCHLDPITIDNLH